MKNKFTWIIVVVIVLVGIWFLARVPAVAPTRNLDAFATCLKDKGALFYGAFWCPHCQNQKKLFGASASLLPYVECSTPDGQHQNDVCNQKGVQGYPTWVFSDNSRLTGEVDLQTLAQKTSCTLPQ